MLKNRYIWFTCFFYLFTWLMSLAKGMPPIKQAWRLEVPLLICLYYYFNSITRPSKWQPYITAMPLILAYGVFEAYFMSFGRLLRIIEIKELPELIGVFPIWVNALLVFLFGFPLIAFFRLLRKDRIKILILGGLPFIAIVSMTQAYPDQFLVAFETVQKDVTNWSDIQSAEDNGRLWMMLYLEAKRNSNLKKIADFKDSTEFIKKRDDILTRLNAVQEKRNIHLIALESFVDPELFKGLSFSMKPMHPDFEKIFKNKGSISISPVFGGGTAQAEFELLTGAPALSRLSSMEFDVFTGAETFGLPALLTKAGYHTMATNAYKPDFFNSINAYAGLGFQKSYYPREYAKSRETYLSTGDVTGEKYMFDGELLKQNLAFIDQWKASHPGVPLFNYVISIYGHYPHLMNQEKRPSLIEVKGAIKDGHLENCINQYYYRTEALAQFVNEIKVRDPESLVILISDHLPWVYGPETYKKLDYAGGAENFSHINRVFFFERGRAIQFDTVHHYDIPDLILNFITGGDYCKTYPCSFGKKRKKGIVNEDKENIYMTIMAHAMTSKS